MSEYGYLILDAAFVLTAFVILLINIKRGFLKSLIRFARLILAFIAAYLWGGSLASFLVKKWLGSSVSNAFHDKFLQLYQSASGSFDVYSVLDSLPRFLLTDGMEDKIKSAGGNGEALVDSATEAIAGPVADFLGTILGYIGVFLAALLILTVGVWLLSKLVERIRFLNFINRFLGALLGVAIAASVLFVAGSIVRMFFSESTVYTSSYVAKFFGESSVLDVIAFFNVGKEWFSSLLL